MRSLMRLRHHLGRQPDANAGGWVGHHAPAEFLFAVVRGGEQPGAFVGGELAGDVMLDALLEILHRGQHWIKVANGTGVVARP